MLLHNHFRFALRNIVRNRMFSAINIGGLAVSLTAFILMSLYIEYELSYDKFNVNANEIYRVVDDKQTTALKQHSAMTSAPVAPALLNDFPEVKKAVRLISAESLVKYDDKLFEERNLFFADAGIFNLFSIDMLKGNSFTALKDPLSVVLTANTATKYFGTANPLGKIMMVDGKSMKVTGVISELPKNSHISFDMLISMATAQQKDSGYDWLFNNWYSNNFYTYVLLPVNYNTNNLLVQFDNFDKRHRKTGSTTVHHYNLEKLTDIYLHSDRDNQIGKTGSLNSIYVFSAIAIFILLIACINFINLSTARAAERSKEVAIKKVNGVSRKQLAAQFFIESFLMTTIATVFALVMATAFIPSFNSFSGKEISLNVLTPVHIVAVIGLVLFIGLLSGFYPAFVISGFKPVAALKGNVKVSSRSVDIRKCLVIFQFSISIILIISSLVVYNQLQFMQRHDLGFKPSQTMVINFEGDNAVQRSYKTIMNELLAIPGIKDISASSNVPGDLKSGGWSMDFAKKTGDTVHTELPIYLTDYNYLRQFNIPMVAGRPFSEHYAADTVESLLINETALKKLGFNNADEAIGVKVGMYPSDGRIIGVFKDFHFESLQKPIMPLAMRVIPNKFRLFSLQMNTNAIKQTVADIEKIWKKVAPQRPLEYTFLDESFNKQYQAETRFGQLFLSFTVLAIAVACLGLFGLALFSVKQRTKEIGVRKVIGASVAQITGLISKDFIYLVLVAIIIASPVAWYAMNKWIETFAYRITIEWWLFAAGGFIALAFAFATVSYQAVRAALINPVKSLRSE